MARIPQLLEQARRRPIVAGGAAALAVLAVVATLLLATAGDDEPAVTASPNGACEVRLHGKSGDGDTTVLDGDVTVVRPAGNAEGWGGRQWLYFPDAEYEAARRVVADAITTAGCTRVALNGFSNGGAFAAALDCRGETFDGRLKGVMVDDPVTDQAVEGCTPPAGVPVVLYWTGALEGQAVAGWPCASADWTCAGGSTIGVAAYAAALGTTPAASPNREHTPHVDAPEPARWLSA